jgi:hypothetical protein
MLAALFPCDRNLPSRLIATLGEERALRIACTLSAMAELAHRKKYALNAIRNQEEIDQHEDWLEKNPPYEDFVDEDELREMSADIRARHREIRWREEKNAILKGEMSAFDVLVDAKGRNRAIVLYQKITNALILISPPTRIRAILKGASTARYPDAYVATAIENERARVAKQKKASRSHPRGRGGDRS